MRRAVVLAFALAPACEVSGRCATGELCTSVRLVPLTIAGGELVTGDVDGDGRRDVVAADSSGFGVGVRWGAPEGPTLATRWSAPAATRGVRLGDVDGDGRVDIVALTATDSVTDGAAWLRNTGGRAFAPARSFALAVAAGPGVVADVDGDGADDLVVAEIDAARLHVLRGGPDGFGRPSAAAIGGEAVALAAGDFDGDGADEVVAAVPSRGRVEVLRGAEVAVARASAWPQALAAADLDGDGALDLAVGDGLEPSVWVGFGDGRGGWSKGQVWPATGEPGRLVPLRGADGALLAVYAAARPELAVIDPRSGALRTETLTWWPLGGVAAYDLDGDGRDELLAAGEVPRVLREVEGFRPAPRWRWPLVGEAGKFALADLDGDGQRELVVEDVERSALIAYAPAGAGYAELARVELAVPLGGLVPLALGDGREGLARWGGSQWFSGHVLEVMSYEPGDGLAAAAAVELGAVAFGALAFDGDGDGRDELAVRTGEADYGLTLAKGLAVARLTDDGALAVEEIAEVFAPMTLSATDGDGDGRATLWAINQAGRLSEIDATADGWTVVERWLPAFSESVAWIDGDGDGAGELLTCGMEGVGAVRELDGPGEVQIERLSDAACSRVQACDVDGDGADELVITRETTTAALVFGAVSDAAVEVLRAGADGWRSAGSFAPSAGATAVEVGCAADGLLLASSGPLGAEVAGVTPGPALHESRPGGAHVAGPLVADVDGDGVDELLGATQAALLLASVGADGEYGPVRALALPVPGPLTRVAAAPLDDAPGAELLVSHGTPAGTASAVWGLREGALVELGTPTWLEGHRADFDGDGREEFLQWTAGGLQLARLLPRTGEPAIVPVTLAGDAAMVTKAQFSTAIADADGDGLPDLLIGDETPAAEPDAPYSNTLWVLRNAGEARFEAPREWTIAGPWRDVGFGDVDEDGVGELLVVTDEEALEVCGSDGRGGPRGGCRTWWSAPARTALDEPRVGDVDGDGVADVFAVIRENYQTPKLLVLRGAGGGRVFELAPIDLPAGGNSYWIVGAARLPEGRAWVLGGTHGAVVIGGGR
jgi:hypothetical protein